MRKLHSMQQMEPLVHEVIWPIDGDSCSNKCTEEAFGVLTSLPAKTNLARLWACRYSWTSNFLMSSEKKEEAASQ